MFEFVTVACNRVKFFLSFGLSDFKVFAAFAFVLYWMVFHDPIFTSKMIS